MSSSFVIFCALFLIRSFKHLSVCPTYTFLQGNGMQQTTPMEHPRFLPLYMREHSIQSFSGAEKRNSNATPCVTATFFRLWEGLRIYGTTFGLVFEGFSSCSIPSCSMFWLLHERLGRRVYKRQREACGPQSAPEKPWKLPEH